MHPREYTNSEITRCISEHIHSQRDREILYKRLVDGLTFERLGEIFDMSDRQIKSIVYKNEQILFRHLPP